MIPGQRTGRISYGARQIENRAEGPRRVVGWWGLQSPSPGMGVGELEVLPGRW